MSKGSFDTDMLPTPSIPSPKQNGVTNIILGRQGASKLKAHVFGTVGSRPGAECRMCRDGSTLIQPSNRRSLMSKLRVGITTLVGLFASFSVFAETRD